MALCHTLVFFINIVRPATSASVCSIFEFPFPASYCSLVLLLLCGCLLRPARLRRLLSSSENFPELAQLPVDGTRLDEDRLAWWKYVRIVSSQGSTELGFWMKTFLDDKVYWMRNHFRINSHVRMKCYSRMNSHSRWILIHRWNVIQEWIFIIGWSFVNEWIIVNQNNIKRKY